MLVEASHEPIQIQGKGYLLMGGVLGIFGSGFYNLHKKQALGKKIEDSIILIQDD